MNILNPVSTIMTKNLVTLSPDASIYDVGELFGKHKIHHVPVVDGDELKGLVSKTDYLSFRRGYLESQLDKSMEEERLKQHNLSAIMTKGIAKLEPTDRINVVLEIFKENLFHAIPVVEEGKLVGIVTTLDIIVHLAEDRSATAEYNTKK